VWSFLLILSLFAAPLWAIGQTADDYFHKGAQYYIFNEKEKATKEIYTGLQTYPTDPKLNAVAKLLQKKDQKDQKNQNQQQQQQQQQQDQKSAQQKKDEEKARQEQAKKDQEKKEQQAQANPNEEKDKQDETAGQAAAELRMSPQEARQLLDSMKDDSKVLLFAPTNQPTHPQRGKFKDW